MLHGTFVSKSVLCAGVEDFSYQGGNKLLSPSCHLQFIVNNRGLHVKGTVPNMLSKTAQMKATLILVGQKNCDYEKPEKTKTFKKKALIKHGQLDRAFFRLSHARGRCVPTLI